MPPGLFFKDLAAVMNPLSIYVEESRFIKNANERKTIFFCFRIKVFSITSRDLESLLKVKLKKVKLEAQ